MLEKLKTMKYEHFENEQSVEIINKAFFRAETQLGICGRCTFTGVAYALLQSIGSLAYLFNVRWWLPITVLIPSASRNVHRHKSQLQHLHGDGEVLEQRASLQYPFGSYLRSRNFTKELKSYGNYDYLIDTYTQRLNERNRDYEHYYFKNLRQILLSGNITKTGEIVNPHHHPRVVCNWERLR